MENNKFLPLGSVVLLKDAKRYVVIIGYAVIEEGSTKVWDYMGCAYPIGVITSTGSLLFNRNQIEKIIHTGFSDEEGNKFLKDVGDTLDKNKHE